MNMSNHDIKFNSHPSQVSIDTLIVSGKAQGENEGSDGLGKTHRLLNNEDFKNFSK